MNIKQLVQDLQLFYDEMGKAFSDYQQSTGLTCLSGCAKCCDNPNITATTLEMLPMAWDLYQRGLADEWYEKLISTSSEICPLIEFASLDRMQGKCTEYKTRPIICRGFGVYGHVKKDKSKALSVCKYIKNDKDNQLIQIAESEQGKIPLMSEWTTRLLTIHPDLTSGYRPVAESLKLALEKVLLYHQYSL